MAGTHRCSRCSHDWPDTAHYLNCPDCGERTDYLYSEEPMPLAEAESLRHRLAFRDWLENETDYERAKRREQADAEERRRLERLEAMLTVDQPQEAA